MKSALLIGLIVLFTCFDTFASCETISKQVEKDIDFLWSLKLNSNPVSEAEYKKAYANYESNLNLKTKLCK